MAYVDYKCLESLLIEGGDIIVTESTTDDVLSLSEDKYNKYFLTIKSDCVRIIKDMMKEFDNPKAKFIIGEHKVGKFKSNFIGYNEICIGHFKYVTSSEISSLINNFLSTANEKYSDLISEKLMYVKCENDISLYLSFRKYNTINDEIVPKLKNEIDICINVINKDLKTPLYLSTKKNIYTLILSRLKHMITVLNSPGSTTIVTLKNDIDAINNTLDNVITSLVDRKVKSQINIIESMINQLV